MRVGKISRKIWHDIYYALSFRWGVKFALNCEEATRRTDLGQKKDLRFYLHLSVCQACKNYYAFTEFLRRNLRTAYKASEREIKTLNAKLLKKFNRG